MTDVLAPPFAEAEAVLFQLARVFFPNGPLGQSTPGEIARRNGTDAATPSFDEETRYQMLVEQLPAVVFMASLHPAILSPGSHCEIVGGCHDEHHQRHSRLFQNRGE